MEWESELRRLVKGLSERTGYCETPEKLVNMALLREGSTADFKALARHIMSCDRCCDYWDRIQSFEHLSFQEIACISSQKRKGDNAVRLQEALASVHINACPTCQKLRETAMRRMKLEKNSTFSSKMEEFLFGLFGTMSLASRAEKGPVSINASVLNKNGSMFVEHSGALKYEEINVDQCAIDQNGNIIISLSDIPMGYGEAELVILKNEYALDLGRHRVIKGAVRIDQPCHQEPRRIDLNFLQVSLYLA